MVREKIKEGERAGLRQQRREREGENSSWRIGRGGRGVKKSWLAL